MALHIWHLSGELRVVIVRVMHGGSRTVSSHGASSKRSARLRWGLGSLLLAGLGLALWSRERHPSSTPSSLAPAGAKPAREGAPRARAARAGTRASSAQRQELVRGVVRARAGAALSNAIVCQVVASAPDALAERCVTTDPSGRFLLSDVSQSVTALLASAHGHQPLVHPLERSAAEQGELMLELQPGGDELSGEVVDATGGPVSGAVVTLRSPTADVAGAALSGVDGSFTLHQAPGEVELCAHAEAYSRACRRVAIPSQGHVLLLAPESKLVGEVLMRGTGQPVAGASVTASNANGLHVSPRSAVSGEDGSFVIDALPAGGYRLVASSSSARSAEEWAALGMGDTSTSLTLWAEPAVRISGAVLLDGEPCPGGVVDLSGPIWARGHIMAEGTFQIDGVLPGRYDAVAHCGPFSRGESLAIGSEPLEHDWSLEKPATPPAEQAAAPPRTGTLQVTVEGALEEIVGVFAERTDGEWFRAKRAGDTFLFERLPEGEYRVRINDYFEQAQPARITHEGARAHVRLTSTAPGWINGRVLSDTGLPVADAWVGYVRSDAPSSGAPARLLTDERGGFRAPAAPGVPYSLSISSPLGDAQLDGVQAGSASAAELLVRVSAPAALSGTVQTARGEPVPEFTLTYRRTDAPELHELRGANSAFHLSRLQPGTYSLQVSSPLGGAAQEMQLEASKRFSITMTLDSSKHTVTN